MMNKLFISLIFFISVMSLTYIKSDNKTVLITGGAGYIGSATVLYMLEKNYNVIVLDKKKPDSKFFQNSQQITRIDFNKKKEFENQSLINRVIFIESDYAQNDVLEYIFKNYNIEAVIHFAGFIEVGLSVKDPAIFYKNNVIKTIYMLDIMQKFNVKKFIFSSSAAVYGIPQSNNLLEENIKNPINPYGKTKLVIEMVLQDYVSSYKMQAICLRYFNAAGALPDYDIGERHNPETHLIPLLLKAAYSGSQFHIFGTDYNTPDGTCIRDYLHIYDLAKAHYLALKNLDLNMTFNVFNLGTGNGYSVKQVIEITQKITGQRVNITESNRRPGDPDRLVANASKAEQILGWKPTMSSLENIILTANEFYRNQIRS